MPAKSWKTKRRIIIKAEHTSKGRGLRCIVTNLFGESQSLYDDVYCVRGDMENRIKEQQLDLFADHTSGGQINFVYCNRVLLMFYCQH